MHLGVEAAVGVGALVTALAALWLARKAGRRLRRALGQAAASRRGRRCTVDALPLGREVALRGRVVPIDLIESPNTRRSGVYLGTVVEALDSTPDITGVRGRWLCVERSEEVAPFELLVGDRRIPVDPTGARVLAPSVEGKLGEERRFSEAILPPDAEVVVLGRLLEQGGLPSEQGYRQCTVRRVLGGGSGELLIATPPLFRRSVAGRHATSALALVATLSVAAFALLLATQTLPVVRTELPGAPVMSWPPPGDYARYFRRNDGDVRPAGQAVGEAWVLGWITGGKPESLLYAELEEQLWRRQLNGIGSSRTIRRRAYLLFDVLRIEGVALRYDVFWRSFCAIHPEACRR